MNKLDAAAYAAAFQAIFDCVKKSCPHFGVGKTLKGIITDWSDAQICGLKAAIGEDNTNKLVKGCQVYFELDPAILSNLFYTLSGSLPAICEESQSQGQRCIFTGP